MSPSLAEETVPDGARPAVPEVYHGVWSRTLLRTPTLNDTRTFVRWLQTSLWHADLRVPVEARPADGARPELQQGFSGVTEVEHTSGEARCHWHRHVDFQPPGLHPDCGRVAFETPERLIETGVHADYLEVWDRVPDSTGRYAVLEAFDAPAGQAPTRWLLAGAWLMRVRPRRTAWPVGTTPGTTLQAVLQAHPQAAAGLLDFEISFGRLVQGRWHITQSSLPALEGRVEPVCFEREAPGAARLVSGPSNWRIVEWSLDGKRLD